MRHFMDDNLWRKLVGSLARDIELNLLSNLQSHKAAQKADEIITDAIEGITVYDIQRIARQTAEVIAARVDEEIKLESMRQYSELENDPDKEWIAKFTAPVTGLKPRGNDLGWWQNTVRWFQTKWLDIRKGY